MSSHRFNRIFRNFHERPWGGKNLPEFYDRMGDAGDGIPGVQWMVQAAISAYGPYHIIEGCDITVNGNSVTGSAGYAMWSGAIIQVTAGSGALSLNERLIINQDGSYGITGGTPTGVVVARRFGFGTVETLRKIDSSSKEYFPRDVTIYDSLTVKRNINNTGNIYSSGLTYLNGDVQTTGDLYNSANIYGVHFSGAQFTGTSGSINRIIATRTTSTTISGTSVLATNLEGSTVNYTQVTGTSGDIDDIQGTTLNYTQVTGTSGLVSDIKGTRTNYTQVTGTYGKIDYINSLDRINDRIYYVSTYSQFTSALSSIGSGKGKIIVTESFSCASNVNINGGGSYVIEGLGANIIISGAVGTSAITVSNHTSCVIRNITIWGGGGLYDPAAILVTCSNDSGVLIDNVNIDCPTYMYGHGIRLYSDNNIVRDCTITGGECCINIYSAHNNTIRGNRLVGGGTAASCYGIRTDYAYLNTIEDNHVKGADIGIFLRNGPTGGFTSVSNNHCYENDVGIRTYEIGHVSIIGNHCYKNNQHGIMCDQFGTAETGNIISANQCSDNGGTGLYNDTDYTVITNNVLRRNGTNLDNDGSSCQVGYNIY